MKIYWSINSIPELANLTPAQRKQAWKECYWKYAFKHWQTWASLALLGFLVAVGSSKGIIPIMIAGGIGGGIFGVVVTSVLQPYLADYARKITAENEP